MTLACGKRIPASEHAVSLSLPTLQDVIGYEEKSESVFRHVCSGYPRFVRHWTVLAVQEQLQRQREGRAGHVVVLHDQAACERLMTFLGRTLELVEPLPFGAVVLPETEPVLLAEAQLFLQHTGTMLSSRQAEDFLLEGKARSRIASEALFEGPDPDGVVKQMLAVLYGVAESRIGLYPSGMNAYFSVFDAINRRQRAAGRDEWMQVGWLYLDTTAILDRFAVRHVHIEATATQEIEAYVHAHHDRLAGITTEVLTNPLLQTPDLQRLSALARRYGLPLLVDISMPTPVNVDVLPYADVIIESLTKFASGHADVMGGAAVFNPHTEWGLQLREAVADGRPYVRDSRRMAYSISGYAARMETINANTQALTDYFRGCRQVRQVYWAGQPDSAGAYHALRRAGGGEGGVVSVVFEKPLAAVYDRLPLLKGPSFGTEFTLCMAYVYMAHYPLVMTETGRARLRQHGIDPGLLRISVGLEPIDSLILAFETSSVDHCTVSCK